jgi:Zn-dependent metalloprotease
MKKITFITTVLSLCLSIGIFAQKQNPFDVKKKENISTGKISASLNMQNIQTGNNPLVDANYHSIPFAPLGNIENGTYSKMRFNKKGQLIFIEGSQKDALSFDANQKSSVELAAIDYLNSIKKILQIDNPASEFQTIEFHQDNQAMTHIKLQQYYHGLKVYLGQVFVHGKNGLMTKFNGECFPTPDLDDLSPSINLDEAISIAKADIKVPFIEPGEFEKSLVDHHEIVSELIVYHPDFYSNEAFLTWHLTVRPNFLRRFEYFVDAKTGEILNSYNHTCSDGPTTAQANDLNGVTQTINTYNLGGTYFLIDASRPMYNAGQSELPNNPVGAIWTIDANNSAAGGNINLTQFSSSNNTWNSPASVSAHYNAGETYEYYKNTHGRNSINGQGGTIISICNIANEDGSSMDNAFWNGQAMFYGNGASFFTSLAGALDVGAHEMGHGVVQNTCNLEYQGESGALNESMADISGCMVDREDWHLGEDIIPNTNNYPTGFLRDMSNPHNGGTSLNDQGYQPAHLSEKYTGSQDNGGVHINSGIMNFAFYKFATTIGKEKAEKIWYKSMTDYLVKASQFADARVAFVNASTDLYGASSTETTAVKNAFAEVGIGEGSGGNSTPGQDDLQTNPGQDYILFTNTSSDYPSSLYIKDIGVENYAAVTTTPLAQKPSVVDNGYAAIFVTPQHELKSVILSGDFEENSISSDLVFDNASISKDGNRIAFVSTSIDSAIYVYDYGLNTTVKYHLYNPTFSGEVTENVLYADALEWDYSGQYIIYDAYNKMQNASGEDIDYWDMSVIRVWNNASNTWGDGKIEKVFANLPEGVSVGNPSLSKNSPYILAFDYFNQNDNTVSVMAANLQTGESGVIFQNMVLGYPNYSKNDDKIIFTALDMQNQEIIGEIGLQSNKIQPSGEPTGIIGYAKWGIWFATGNRSLGVNEYISGNLMQVYPNPAKNTLVVHFTDYLKEEGEITIYNTLGQVVYQQKLEKNKISFNINLSDLPEGNYLVQWKDKYQSSTAKFIKL